LADNFFGVAKAIDRRTIQKVNSLVQRRVDGADGLGILCLAVRT
jgi:hypothetical protein